MKILVLSEKFFPDNIGGAEMVALRSIKELQKMGHSVFVISVTDEKNKEGRFFYDKILIYRIYSNFPKVLINYISLHNFLIIPKIKKIILDENPDIVHAHLINTAISYYVLKVAKKMGCCVFLTAHDHQLYCREKQTKFDKYNNGIPVRIKYKVNWFDSLKSLRFAYNPFRNLAIRYYLKFVDKIFSVSKILERVLEINNINNIVTIYNSIDLSDFKVSLKEQHKFIKQYNLFNKKVILFGGRISKSKGAELLVAILARIVKEEPKSVLIIMGRQDGLVEKIKKDAKDAGIINNIVFTGWISGHNLALPFYCCDLCITPSIYLDPFNLTNLEAMAAKKPVVGTCFGGTKEIVVDNQTGYIVNPFDIKVMVDKIVDLLRNSEKAERFGLAGYNRASMFFNLEKQTQKIIYWYNLFLEIKINKMKK
ncbi:glycosyltransferase family 4 protein [Patescibacteria group bacterium]